jgi:hypothetical protein
VSNGRVAFENLIKYGVLISPTEWFILAPVDASKWPMVTMILWSNVSILLALFAEKLLARGIFGNRFAVGFYVTLILAHFTIPAIQVLNYDGNPLFSFCGLTVLVIEGLKLISYGHVNYWYRCAQAENSVSFLILQYLTFLLEQEVSSSVVSQQFDCLQYVLLYVCADFVLRTSFSEVTD